MSNRLTAALVAVAAGAVVLWNSVFIVNEKEQAIVLRFGEIRRVVNEPGLYFKVPFGFAGADTVQMLPDRLLRFDLDNIRVQVSGGKFYEVDAFLVYSISDAKRFRETVSGSIPQAEQRLRTRLDAALRRVYGLRGFEAALSDERGEMMRQVRDQLRPDAESLGIELADVRIRRTDLTQEVSQQTYERMQAERLAEAERLRARGQVAARQIRATADRGATEATASAQRESEILQGEGDAERSRIYADAYSRNPEFFEFFRSMRAYREALANTGTTMVLSPESEFFRYFNDAGTGSPSGAAAPAPVGAEPSAAAPAPLTGAQAEATAPLAQPQTGDPATTGSTTAPAQ
ncbi:protease modulator HflC [Aurantimonas sp. Leaf443]|uniref:protease modulator HflC n=1 Tax=Aurantimonas sp. Leaf443 TaxID=1736378 RepID=UPI0006FDFFFA|nr:protease modulator HflC [Aurantimonas sp. Leaf443]KQT86080.1 protease modulator HflC [Aurantimonas sp. Leaf443]